MLMPPTPPKTGDAGFLVKGVGRIARASGLRTRLWDADTR